MIIPISNRQTRARATLQVQGQTKSFLRAAQIRSEKRSATYVKINFFSSFLTRQRRFPKNSAHKRAARTR